MKIVSQVILSVMICEINNYQLKIKLLKMSELSSMRNTMNYAMNSTKINYDRFHNESMMADSLNKRSSL